MVIGRDHRKSDMFLREIQYSRYQAELDIHPTSLDLICRNYSSHRTTTLLFNDDCGPVGTWVAREDDLVEQTILPSSDAVLDVSGARFTFLWYAPSKEREIRACKESFVRREISEDMRRTPPLLNELWHGKRPNAEYPEQYNYDPAINLLELLNVTPDIRYMIFRLVVLHRGSIKPYMSPSLAREKGENCNTVHGCIDLLNRSHQLLNPLYSSRSLAIEAAGVFYSQNIFEVNILDISRFIWTVKHMPSLEPFDPLSTIDRLRLWLNCDASPATVKPHPEPRWWAQQFAAQSRPEAAASRRAHEWSDTEKEGLLTACTVVRTQLPALEDFELHVRREAMCWSFQETAPDADPPLHIFEAITPIIKRWMGRGGRNVRVFLHGQRWRWNDGAWPRAFHSEDVVEDITAWWHDHTGQEEDEETAYGENLDWLASVAWDRHWVEEDWKRKGAVEAAQMRLRVTEWLRRDGDGGLNWNTIHERESNASTMYKQVFELQFMSVSVQMTASTPSSVRLDGWTAPIRSLIYQSMARSLTFARSRVRCPSLIFYSRYWGNVGQWLHAKLC